MKSTIVGILAVQGDFAEHALILKKLNAIPKEIRTLNDLENIHGLIIPGGESTSIGKQIKKNGLEKKIKELGKNGLPIMGTCAGAILLADKVIGKCEIKLNLIHATLERNAYGGQNNSFESSVNTSFGKIQAAFIRAPKIKKIGNQGKILGKIGNEIVLAEEKNILIASFHPEISGDPKLHQYFLEKIKRHQAGC
ncbi:MAG: pyridoxal 5'-phosphate synthase glutaminase subunit PdxT [Candidatus Diapherotrites archaeon]|nr:pyridoxal 5'-phosphate synthase glutaminase subunit PdxT [Candidatus Diapherotrites archaeon]